MNPSNETDTTFRDEALLRAALQLDDDDLAFLQAARLPSRLIARAVTAPAAAPRTAVAPRSTGGLWWLLAACAASYAGWLLALPALGEWLDLARRAGLTALLLSWATSLALQLGDVYLGAVEAASQLPGFDAPLVALSALAVLGWLALSFLPAASPRRAAAAQGA